MRGFSRASSVALSSPLLGVRSIGQRVSARGNVIIATNSAVQSQRVFIELELASISEVQYLQMLKEEAFAHYQPWLRLLRLASKYNLEPRL